MVKDNFNAIYRISGHLANGHLAIICGGEGHFANIHIVFILHVPIPSTYLEYLLRVVYISNKIVMEEIFLNSKIKW